MGRCARRFSMEGVEERNQREGRGSILPFLVVWLIPGLVDVVVALGAYVKPASWQVALELLLLAGMAWAQWTFGRGWGRSLLLAAAVLVFFGTLPHAPATLRSAAPFLAGVAIPLWWGLRWASERRTISAAAGSVIAVLVVLGVHWVDFRSQQSVTTGGAEIPSPAAGLPDGNSAEGPPVVVISVDTLRADAAESMQSVARLGALGATWSRAMSTSSWTLPALASLQTGLDPADHGAGCLEDGHCQGLSLSVSTLAEELRGKGWGTGAVVANPWAGEGMGFARGFERFIDPGQPGRRLIVAGMPDGPHGQDDARTVDAALDWLERAPSSGFYLWVHLMGPHMPYIHSSIDKMRELDPVTLRSSYPTSERQKQEIRDAYAAEVAYTDSQVMRLLDTLESRGVLESGVVFLTSDHGEEFWEHGGVEHGHSHHGEVVDVPLVLVAPGVSPGLRRGLASLKDVASTIRAVAGLPAEGIDLREDPPVDRIATAWGGIILRLDCSARGGSARLISRDCSEERRFMRRYDLDRDPEEYAAERPADEDPLVGAVRAVRSPETQAAASKGSDRLRALGYLQ